MPYTLFAVTAPGLEPLAERELAEMGVRGAAEPGGVAWEGGLEDLYAANLRLRTASRVLVRIAEFKARAFYELERHLKRVEWERFVEPGAPVRLRVTSAKSKLYHENAIAERVLREIAERVGGIAAAGDAAVTGADRDDIDPGADTSSDPAAAAFQAGEAAADPRARAGDRGSGGDDDDETAAGAGPLFVIRLHRDRCTVSADSSGELLHRRGYRVAVAKAPLRETLAAALLDAAGWDRRAPLLDPFCGAGTIPIEAALAARRIAPGLARPDLSPRAYAFEGWREHDPALWSRVVERAAAEALPAAPGPIVGSDRDAGAVAAALANAGRAGVAGDLELEQKPLSAIEPPPGPGLLVTNPPYGLRVGERKRLRSLYAALGRVAREELNGWSIAMLSADPILEAQTGLELDEALRTRNGGIPVRLVVGRAGRAEGA